MRSLAAAVIMVLAPDGMASMVLASLPTRCHARNKMLWSVTVRILLVEG
jgi:hypothetical protein